MKRFLILFFILSTVGLNAAPMVGIDFINSSSQHVIVNATDPLPVNAVVNIASVAVTSFPVFANTSGNATAEVDVDSRVKVNLSSDSIGLISALSSILNRLASDANGLKVSAASATPLIVDEYGPSTASTTFITLSAAPAPITTLANRRGIALIASGSWQCYIGTTTVTASGADIYNVSFLAGPEIAIAVGTNATATTLTVYQQGR